MSTKLQFQEELDYKKIEKIKELGAGAFGSVHMVRYKGMTCAMKQLKTSNEDIGKMKKLVDSLKLEARALAKLGGCPYIIQFVGTCLDERGRMCMLMEYIPGKDLAKLIQSKDFDKYTWDIRQKITMEAALGLDFIHSQNIIHRDIKSDNILIEMDGEQLHTKIADFGICRVEKDAEALVTNTFMGAGSPFWMAPEIYQKYNVKPSKKTDVYALGVVMWEIAACSRPYQNMDHSKLGIYKQEGRIEEVPSTTPVNYYNLLVRCQHPDPVMRPFADEVAYLLKSWIGSYDTHILDSDEMDLGTIFGTKFYEPTSMNTKIDNYEAINEDKFIQLINRLDDDLSDDKAKDEIFDMIHIDPDDDLGKFYMIVATIFFEGAKLTRDYKKAVKYYNKAAELENIEGITRLGIMYRFGYGLNQPDYKKAILLFNKAVGLGSAAGECSLGECYVQGLGVEINMDKAFYYLVSAAKKDFPQALYLLGHYYYNGEGVELNYNKAYGHYLKAADKNHAEAQFSLGLMYKHGIGLTQNDEEALKWFRKASVQGHSRAQNNAGSCYYFGIGAPKDVLEAAGWFRKAALQGNPSAQHNLGECFANGYGVNLSHIDAFKWFTRSAEQNHAGAQLALGMCYFTGQGTEKDSLSAVRWFKKAADQNNTLAQSALAQCYLRGQGTSVNPSQGYYYAKLAAEANQLEGMYQLACCYFNGIGTNKDYYLAFEWFLKASMQDHVPSTMALANCYKEGLGVPASDEECFKCYLKLADKGDPDAQSNVGACYWIGKGVAMDLEKAYEYFKLAAQQKNTSAMTNMAQCLQRGQGVEKDEFAAVEWYIKASDLGAPLATFNLGVCHERGDGVHYKDMHAAMRYYELAGNKGFQPATDRLNELKERINKVKNKRAPAIDPAASHTMVEQPPNKIESEKSSCCIM